jgi:hypothetical protein
MHYILYTDASDVAIGACLAQTDNAGVEKPIYFLSHKFSKSQTHWPIIEREAFAIHFEVQKFHAYLYQSHVIIRTDHKRLVEMLEKPSTNRRIQMWTSNLQQYSHKYEYIKGANNICTDLLSRIAHNTTTQIYEDSQEEFKDINDNNFQINIINTNRPFITNQELEESETSKETVEDILNQDDDEDVNILKQQI